MTPRQLFHSALSPSSSSQLDVAVSSTQTTTIRTTLTGAKTGPSAGHNSASNVNVPTPPNIVIVLSTHLASEGQSESVPAMGVQEPATPLTTTLAGLPETAPTIPEPPPSPSVEVPSSNPAATNLATPAPLPISTPTSSSMPEPVPTRSSLPPPGPIFSSTPAATQSALTDTPRTENDSITLPLGVFSFLIVAVVACVVLLASGIAFWCTSIRRRNTGGDEQQQIEELATVRKDSPLTREPETEPTASATGALCERSAHKEQLSGSEREHVRLSVFPGWPKWVVQRAMGTDNEKRHVDFETMAGRGAGS